MEQQHKESQTTVYNENILQRARETIQQMTAQGNDCLPIPVGATEDALWVSANPAQILGTQEIVVDGKTYFIGLNVDTI